MRRAFKESYVLLVALALFTVATASGAEGGGRFVDHLEDSGRSPADYVLSKLQAHRVVLLGEHHWIRHDVELVLALIPKLPEAGVYTSREDLEVLWARELESLGALSERFGWSALTNWKEICDESW